MTVLVIVAIIAMTLLGAAASWMLKLASSSTICGLFVNWRFYAGAAGYGIAALVNIWVLRQLDLSVVLPLTSLTYVWTLIIGHRMLAETITRRRLAGVLAILVGVSLISLT